MVEIGMMDSLSEAKNVSHQMIRWSCSFPTELLCFWPEGESASSFPAALWWLHLRPRLEFLCSPEMSTVRHSRGAFQQPMGIEILLLSQTVLFGPTVPKPVQPPEQFFWVLGHNRCFRKLKTHKKWDNPSEKIKKCFSFSFSCSNTNDSWLLASLQLQYSSPQRFFSTKWSCLPSLLHLHYFTLI